MNKQKKKLRYILSIIPVKDLEREMSQIETKQGYPLDFETIAQTKGITVRELVTKWDFYSKEENNH